MTGRVVKAARTPGRCAALPAAAMMTQNHISARQLCAEKIGELKLSEGDAFVIGNEGHGLSEATVKAASGVAIIPMTEGSESLNAAAAAAICIWETVRAK